VIVNIRAVIQEGRRNAFWKVVSYCRTTSNSNRLLTSSKPS
jgi:hypothetical protein